MATSVQDKAAASGKTDSGGPATVRIGDRFEVQLGARLPEMCGPTAQAFIASDRRKASSTLVALVIDRRLPARQDIASQIERRTPGGVLLPVFRGVTAWPGGDRLVVIVEHPPGVRLAPPLGETFTPFTVERLLAEVAVPMRGILEQLEEFHIAHRAIRADNMFYGAGGPGTLVLGECYSAPAGYTQPSIYEPISRALAMPSGRGRGGSPDDLFAFGVTLAVLLRGGDPRRGLNDDQFLDKRIENGSYEALLDGLQSHARLVPMLRGLLEDNAATRWTPKEFGRFLDLGSVAPPQHPKLRRATLPYSFNGKTYFAPVPLARALARNWSAGVEAVQSDALYDWMGRGPVDAKRLDALRQPDRAGGASRHGRAGSADVDLARAIILLDPDGPIRLREFSAHADGLASALADAVNNQPVGRDGALVLQAQLVEFWASQQTHSLGTSVADLLVKQPRLAAYAQRPGLGFGPDRCAYELNADLACQSPLLGSGAVFDGPGLLQALNERAKSDGELFDHHIAAFLAARIGDQADRQLTNLAAANGDRAALMLARLRLYSAANTRADIDLSQFCRQVVARMGAIIESFHNRPFRRKLARAMDEAASSGNIAEVIALADNARFVAVDREGFSRARAEHQAVTRELAVLKQLVEQRSTRAESLGHRTAATVAGLASAAAAAALLFTHVT